MRVRLLGTGSPDGWPNAFCDCASCLSAQQARQWRGPTSALVDGRLLLDFTPQTPVASLRHDDGLRRVSHVLVTRHDPDVSVPVELLARGRAGHVEPLTVIGPESVIAAWCAWSGPDDQIRWRVALPGDELDLDDYQVRVLAAAAESQDAVVYDLTGPQGKRLLYASDTGPLPEQTIEATTDAAYDLVVLEATFGDRRGPGAPSGQEHLDLSTFADQMVRLRGARALTRRSTVAAVHLSHHSPSDLRSRLAAWGVLVVDDGHEFDLDRPRPRAVSGPGAGAADLAVRQAPPPRRTLVLGGVRSGKSAAAEQILATAAEVTYVATGYVPSADDAEWARRIAQHQARRPAHWATLETTDLADALRQASTPLLVDCLGMWLTEVLGNCGAWDDRSGWREAVQARVEELVEAWHAVPVQLVAVSNEVGSGVVPPTASGRIFRDQLGRLNARLSAASERVLLVVAGRTLDLTAATATGLATLPPALPSSGSSGSGPAIATTPQPGEAPDPTSGTTPPPAANGWPGRERRATQRPPRLPQDTA